MITNIELNDFGTFRCGSIYLSINAANVAIVQRGIEKSFVYLQKYKSKEITIMFVHDHKLKSSQYFT